MNYFRTEKSSLVVEAPIHQRVNLIDSEDKYAEYLKTLDDGTTPVPLLREPSDVELRRWTYPFPVDIWDFWINKNIKPGPHRISSRPPNYIEPPHDHITGGYQLEEARFIDGKPSYVYDQRYLRLWDFIYNPEFFLNPNIEGERRIDFPRYTENLQLPHGGTIPSLLPPYLPDAIYQNHPTMPYYLWQFEMSLISDTENLLLPFGSVVHQRVGFVAAHGERREGDVDQYAFTPFVATLTPSTHPNEKQVVLMNVQRPDYSHMVVYPDLSTYAPMQYGTAIFHRVSAYKTNGWLYFYRQKIRRRSGFATIPDETTYRHIIEIRKKIEQSTNPIDRAFPLITIRKAVMLVLKREAALYFDTSSYRPDLHTYFPPDPSTLNDAQREALAKIDALSQLVLDTINDGFHELVTDPVTNDPVYETTPVRIVTLQVHRSGTSFQAPQHNTFHYRLAYETTVPPYLNVYEPGTLDTAKNSAMLDWLARGENKSQIKITFPRGSHHHASIEMLTPGEYSIVCRMRNEVQNALSASDVFSYIFPIYALSLKIVYTDVNPYETNAHSIMLDATPVLSEAQTSVVPSRFETVSPRWYLHKFANTALTSLAQQSSAANDEAIKHYLDQHWHGLVDATPSEPAKAPFLYSIVEFKSNDASLHLSISAHDFMRPFLFARTRSNPFQAYLLVRLYRAIDVPITFFGERVVLMPYLPNSLCDDTEAEYVVILKDTHKTTLTNRTLTTRMQNDDAKIEFVIHLPQQLGYYTLFVHAKNSTCISSNGMTYPLYTITFCIFLNIPNLIAPQLIYRSDEIDAMGNQLDLHRYDPTEYLLQSHPSDTHVFLDALCRAYARLFHVKLKTYIQLFPFLLKYGVLIDYLFQHHNTSSQLAIVEKLPDEIYDRAPKHIMAPYIFARLPYLNTFEQDESLFYLIFDPMYNRWINILSIDPLHDTDDHRHVLSISDEADSILKDACSYYVHIVPLQAPYGADKQEVLIAKKQQEITQTPEIIPDVSTFYRRAQHLISEIRYKLEQLKTRRQYMMESHVEKTIERTRRVIIEEIHRHDQQHLDAGTNARVESVYAQFIKDELEANRRERLSRIGVQSI